MRPPSTTWRWARRSAALVAAAAIAAGTVGCSGDDADDSADSVPPATDAQIEAADDLRLNEIQVVGTHNSFHIAPAPEELALIEALDPAAAVERDYTHRPIGEQLEEQRIRQIELDVFLDPDGRYATPAFREQAGLGPYDPAMAEPGIKVMHEQDVDYRSVCLTFQACLAEVRAWSDANPGHVPVAIHIQFKDGPLNFPVPEQVRPQLWSPEAMDELDREIAEAFDADRVITPDDVRGDRATLEEAVLTDGWPTLGESRGKVMFFMVNDGFYPGWYVQNYPGLEGRQMFSNAEPGSPEASFVNVDDPTRDPGRIEELVEAGYLVRTRADAPGVEAKAGDTGRRDAALHSGAQWVGTDYPGPDGARPQFGTDYVVQLPGGLAARCNPVTAPPSCADAAVEP